MPRSIDGHGRVEHEVSAARDADRFAGVVDDVGFDARAAGTSRSPASGSSRPGSGLIMMAPVSVCHHVSTTGQRSPPMTL